MRCRVLLLLMAACCVFAADTYNGPRPPKPDIPYILHADHLIQTEAAEARPEQRKNETVYIIPGASSPARTPLAEPIFVMDAHKLSADQLQLYKLEVHDGNREVTIRRKGGPRPLHIMVSPLTDTLYKIEANEPLENGEYSLSPADSNQVFCFEIF